jgi:hypothetical protein
MAEHHHRVRIAGACRRTDRRTVRSDLAVLNSTNPARTLAAGNPKQVKVGDALALGKPLGVDKP